ncbi:MAG: DNA (cytosine-5-)-methyltransferase, partial [Muribaculaceae bacterium]|nr:DNA (cytosine-5-)-methyltransferase [Muribaculaceae bacterium]
MDKRTISTNNFADLLGVSRATVESWIAKEKYPVYLDSEGKKYFLLQNLYDVPEIKEMLESKWVEEMDVTPARDFFSVELFAGAGGLALGMEKAGFKHLL